MQTVRILAPSRDFRYQAKHPLDMAEVLSSAGYDVEVLSLMSSDVAQLHAKRGFGIRSLRLRSSTSGGHGFEAIVRSLLMSHKKCDVVVGVDPRGFVAAHLLARAGRARALVYYAMELCLPEETSDGESARYQARHIRDADLVITTGQHRAEVMRERFALPVMPLVLHNSLIPPPYKGPVLREALRDRGFPDRRWLVVFTGAIDTPNALQEIVDSVPGWPPETTLILIGFTQPGVAEDLANRVRRDGTSDRVCLFGTVPPGHENVFPLTSGASVGLVLKKYRGSILNDAFYTPSKLFEYAAVGLPVICSDQPSLHFVQEEGWGICADPHEPKSIATAVSQILSDPARLTAMSRTALRRFHDEYSMGRQMEAVLRSMHALLASKGVGRT